MSHHEVMSALADTLLHLHGLPVLALVFALPALEASAFVGFVFPGEIAVLLGGVAAFEHRASLWAVALAAVLGAIVGDAVGYAIGRRFGRRLLHRLPRRILRPHHVDKASDALNRLGGRAVFVGRFTAALRVLVPGLAGMAHMPARRFFVWNVAGGTTWAVGCVVLGYAAGTGWRVMAERLRWGGIAVGAFVVVLVAGVVLYRRSRSRSTG